jgi:hypothetical protein
MLEDNIDTRKKNAETITDPSKEAAVEVNAEKTKYMLLPYKQNAGKKSIYEGT